MANKFQGESSFEVGGKKYTLHYSHGALIELEDLLDRGIVEITEEMQSWIIDPKKVRLKLARAVFWVGLRKHHPDVDIDRAGELMFESGGVVTALKGLQSAFGVPDDGEKSENPTQGASQLNGVGTALSSSSSPTDTH